MKLQTKPATSSKFAITVLKGYEGGVQTGTITGTGEATTLAILCEAIDPKVTTNTDKAVTFSKTDEPECDAAAWEPLGQQDK